ncbi:MAG: RNA polymerase sigma factor [Polyangiaceae bacterium]
MSAAGTPATDVELLGRIASGELEAVAELYDRHASMLLGLALRIVRDRAEAEDVIHDAFVAVGDRAGQYVVERGAVGAWLVTLVRNLSIDRTRRRDRRSAIARDVIAHDPEARMAATPVDPEAQLGVARERERVRRALAKLPEVQRATLEIAFFEGLTYAEIAEREGVPLGTIKSRAARALAALREALGAES